MAKRKRRSFRSSMLGLFGLSMLLSGGVTYLIYKGLQIYYRDNVLAEDPLARLRHFMNSIGDIYFFLLLFVPLAILFFFLLTMRYTGYFREISAGIHRLAVGKFDGYVSISSNDEFESIADDINRASKQLKEAVEKGEFAESSKDQLVLNLAHDLRTPLTSVLGYLDFILKDDSLTKEQARHYTSIAYTKSKRLEKLIDQLFETTKLNNGHLPIDRKPLDLSELLTQLSEELFPVFDNAGLEVRLDLEPHLHIAADGELLARVFENLFTNAARYGSDGTYVDVNCRMDGDTAVVQVINYGHTIAPDQLPFLFDMFYTGDKARSHQAGSTGLGLFIAKNIVERHQGAITADSDAIRTVFEVRLPKSGS
ncbi:ATP-binding protein [Paenibacillus thailandensis]|uniref:histidine kinase n=1 Tax=Paenibacillus thailandensis TaxID=393250 RepID=A0ABW5R4H3_9BACL